MTTTERPLDQAYEFDRGIAVRRRAGGEYAADLDPGWRIGGGLNGGYVLAVVGNAVRHRLAGEGHPDPLAVGVHFLSPARPGPATVRTRLLRAGGRHATVAATLSQPDDGEADRVSVLATYGDLARADGEVRTTHPEPQLPPLRDCLPGSAAPTGLKQAAPLLDRLGTRLDPACLGWARGEPSNRGVMQGWFRFADDRPPDPISLLLVVDALPPTTMDLGMPGWAPTLELTVHVRAAPAPGWLKVRHLTRNLAGGYFEEDCDVWDAAGRLVAQSRQLALQPR
ncbi:MAG: thioesterase family protein [Marmoricola sp.]